MNRELIGLSCQGRPLEVEFRGAARAGLRVLFICGQHGDERSIRRHLRDFVETRGVEWERTLPALQLAVLADANPDGYAARTRANAQGIDLNRDHVRLQAPETRALHGFIRWWRPHLVVDFHNYPSRRKHLVEQRLRLAWDVCLDIPTNPATGCRAEQGPLAGLFAQLHQAAQSGGFHFGRYGLYCPDGTFRHSSPQLGDARNTITLRHEAPTLLVEVRNPSRRDLRAERDRLGAALAEAAWEICRWAARETAYLRSFRLLAQPGTRVPFGFRRRAGNGALVPVQDLESGAQRTLGPARDLCQVDARRHRGLPASYRVAEQEALDLVKRHGYRLTPPVAESGHRDVPVEQRGGRLLALLFDEQSRYRNRNRQCKEGASAQ